MTAGRHGRRVIALVAAGAVALAGCGSAARRPPPGPPGRLELGLPLRDAVAQLFAVGFAGKDPRAPLVARLRTRAWGVVVLEPPNAVAPEQTGALVRALVDAGTRGGRPAPLVAAAEPEAFPGVRMDPPPAQGSPSVTRDQARAAAGVLRAAGVGAVLAPSADLGLTGGPAEDRAFGSDPALVARLAREAVVGWLAGRVAPVVGMFPGEGSASQDTQAGPATVGESLGDLRERDLRPFAAALDAGAPAVELSDALYAAFDGVTPAALLPDGYRLLRRTGFEGVAMTGDLVAATAATGAGVGAAAVEALRAGADLIYVPGDAANQEEAYRAVLAAVRRGRVTRERLADALLHVAALKRSVTERTNAR
ncbi:MAG: hypothetical protein E6G10_02540 [Actinobacteria bacterium]|nr:MAG: hypothetical protein E6G10_02540 [Actinomycetota bacterium]